MSHSNNHKNRLEVFFDNDIQHLALSDVFWIYVDVVFLWFYVVDVVDDVEFGFDHEDYDNHEMLLELNKL